MERCYLCRQETVGPLLDFGMQPICNRYLAGPSTQQIRHPFAVGPCRSCGLIQVPKPFPVADLRPVHNWVSYVEPEDHLDHLAEILTGLPGITPSSIFCGMTSKDDSLLDRLRKLGFKRVWRMDPKRDLGIPDSWGGVETVQDRFGSAVARSIAEDRGRPDLIVARHIAEHAHHLDQFMRGLAELVSPGGTIVLESPECSRAFAAGDCTTLWEEHVLYFTQESFHRFFSFSGFSIDRLERFRYPLEDSLVGVARSTGQAVLASEPTPPLRESPSPWDFFVRNVQDRRREFQQILSKVRREQGKIALLGAGHLSAAFINFLGLEKAIDFVVDDDPHKKGLFMPGSGLPIYDSNALSSVDVKLCLLGVNPANHGKVIEKHRAFLERGGLFLSIFTTEGRGPVLMASSSVSEAACR